MTEAMIDREKLLRRALWLAALANVAGAVVFGFPGSWPGRLVSFPEAPLLYRAFAALFVLLFGGAYAYLASRPRINRPFVAFGAIGKATAFAAMVILWLAGQATLPAVLLLSADLALAGVFAWCLAGPMAASR